MHIIHIQVYKYYKIKNKRINQNMTFLFVWISLLGIYEPRIYTYKYPYIILQAIIGLFRLHQCNNS